MGRADRRAESPPVMRCSFVRVSGLDARRKDHGFAADAREAGRPVSTRP